MHKYHYGKEFEKELKQLAALPKVLDVGSGARFNKYLQQYKSWFKNCDYKTLDYDKSTNPDIIADIHNIPLADESYNGILCLSVLEHVRAPL